MIKKVKCDKYVLVLSGLYEGVGEQNEYGNGYHDGGDDGSQVGFYLRRC
jgi:hypothetical protein